MKVHREKKQLPVYALTIGKNGPKLKKAAGEMIELKDGGFAKNRTMFFNHPDGKLDRIQLIVKNHSMQELVNDLSRAMGDRTVVDRTGLAGEFDFTIDYERDTDVPGVSGAVDLGAVGPSMFTAFQEQLGLKLESVTAPVEVLVIDHAEQPSEN